MMKNYACLQCSPDERTIFRHKGLCHECTQYDSEGGVVEPVYRVRTDEYGNSIERIRAERPPVNRSGIPQNVGFRQPRKPTKKQLQREETYARIAQEVPVPTMTETLAEGEEE